MKKSKSTRLDIALIAIFSAVTVWSLTRIPHAKKKESESAAKKKTKTTTGKGETLVEKMLLEKADEPYFQWLNELLEKQKGPIDKEKLLQDALKYSKRKA